MTTREHEVLDPTLAPPPSTSMALVPLRADRAPAAPPPRPADQPRHVHRYFYGMGYAALAMLALGMFFEPRIGEAALGLMIPAVMMLGLAGLGVLIHVIYKPSMPKLRKGLGAVASVALTMVALGPIGHMGQEVHASARIPRLQPIVEGLMRDGRIRLIGVPSSEWVTLNEYHGRLDSSYWEMTEASGAGSPLHEVLQRDGISRLELVRMMNQLKEADAREVRIDPATVTVETNAGPDLLYLRPGQSLAAAAIPERMQTKPLGGGWYLIAGTGWID